MGKTAFIIIQIISYVIVGNLLAITDTTENCYALTAKEMLESGDIWTPRIYGDYWFDKPILYYWEIIIGYVIAGDLGLRLINFITGLIVAYKTFQFASKHYNRKVGKFSAVILMLMPEFWYVGHGIITDMTLLLFMSLTLFNYFEGAYTKATVFAALGVLTKGPIGVVLPLLIIAIDGKFKSVINWRRIILFLLIIGIWYVPMGLMHGVGLYEQFIGVHNVLRAIESEHPMLNVWYYYLIVFLIGVIPWQIRPMITLMKEGLPPIGRTERFLIIWTLTIFIFFEMMATKYPTYTFGYVVPIAILLGVYYEKREELFRKLATVMSLILLITSLIAIPVMRMNSGLEAATIIKPLSESALVVSYQKIYSGSISYYSGLKVYRLERAERIKELKPNGISWNAVNVMPFMSFEELPEGKVIAVVDKGRIKELEELSGRRWELIKELPLMSIYVSNSF